MRGGKTYRAFSPDLKTTKLCLNRSLSWKMFPVVEVFYSTFNSASAAFPLYN